MIIGFTGTRSGMTQLQKNIVIQFLDNTLCEEFHHGGCKGADVEFNSIVMNRGKVVIHPGDLSQSIGYTNNNITILPIKPYLERNKDIVNSCDLLIACPKTITEELRSGTWATIRYAKKMNKDIKLIEPY